MNSNLRDYLLETCRSSLSAMKEFYRRDPFRTLYHMSAIYGALNRVFNIEYDPDLVFAHNVFQQAHQQMHAQFMKVATRAERSIDFGFDVMESLVNAVASFVETLENGTEVTSALGRISEIMYSTTGNGHYLYLRGALRLDAASDDMPQGIVDDAESEPPASDDER